MVAKFCQFSFATATVSMPIVDPTPKTPSGAPLKGSYDQYADGKAAKVWDVFVGDTQKRAANIKTFLAGILNQRGCKRILDAAAGNGVDSIMLLEEGFQMVSVDLSEHMLKSAYKIRWARRKEPGFDDWEIEVGNWLTICDDIKEHMKDGFDAVLCLGNSFSHLLDTYGDQREHRQAFENFYKCLKPGGLLVIDHRDYAPIIKAGDTSETQYHNNVYYNANQDTPIRINTKVHYKGTRPKMVTRDYIIGEGENITELNFSFHPHTLGEFTKNLKAVFGNNVPHEVYGDYKPLTEIANPTYYLHIIEKPKN